MTFPLKIIGFSCCGQESFQSTASAARVGVLHCGGTAVCRWQVFLGAHGIFPWDNPDVFFYLKMYGFGGIINGILWDYMGLYELKQ